MPEAPLRIWATVNGDVKDESLRDPHWWLLMPAGGWSRPWVQNDFFVWSQDLDVVDHPLNDPLAIALITAAKSTK